MVLSTNLTLLTVSKRFYNLAVEVIYRRIELSRSSSLVSLVQVLTTRPQRCAIIRYLAIHGVLQNYLTW